MSGGRLPSAAGSIVYLEPLQLVLLFDRILVTLEGSFISAAACALEHHGECAAMAGS